MILGSALQLHKSTRRVPGVICYIIYKIECNLHPISPQILKINNENFNSNSLTPESFQHLIALLRQDIFW